MKKILLILFMGLLVISPAVAEGFNFDLDLGLEYIDAGVEEPLYGINLQPDIAIGDFGIGLKGSVYFQLDIGGDQLINLKLDNWIPEFEEDDDILAKIQTAASLYLPVITYVRYGYKGDPLHLKLGQIEDVTLGTGMFFNQYSNTSFIPETTLVGAVLDIDGRLFDFPYIGFEALAGNIAQFDTMGGRLYVRPLAFVDFPIIKDLQIAGSYAVDRFPGLYDDSFTPSMVTMFGVDMMLPLLNIPQAALTLFGDAGFQPSPEAANEMATGYRAGLNGHIMNLLKFEADFMFPTQGYKPGYFDASYDRDKRDIYDSDGLLIDNYFLHAGAGFNLFSDAIVFDLDISSEVTYADSTFEIIDPSLVARLQTGEDLVGFFYFDAVYTKNVLADESIEAFLTDIIDLKNSEIRANVSFKYSIFVIETGYIIEFDEAGVMQEPDITVGGTINLF